MSYPDVIKGVGNELILTSAALLAFFGFCYRLYERLLPQPLAGIPYDQKSARRVLGDGPEMLHEVQATGEIHVWILKKVYQLQEPLVQLFVQPFSRPWVILADAVEAQNLMTRRPEFERSDFDRTGLFSLDGFHSRLMSDAWKRSRAWIQDFLSPNFLTNTAGPVWYDSAMLLVDYWDKKTRVSDDRPFDVNYDLDHFAMDGMLSLMFDEQYDHAALDPQIQAVAQLNPSSLKTGGNGEALFPHAPPNKFVAAMYATVGAVNDTTACSWPRFGKYLVRNKYRNSIAVRRQVIEEQVQNAIKRFQATGEVKTGIEYMLMREKKGAEKQGQKPEYESTILRDEIGGQFFAGYHTSSSSISWIFIHLTRAPDVQTKLRDTLHKAHSTAYAERRPPTYAELAKSRVPYLEAVIDEVMRLHATLLSRTATRDTQVLGKFIPKGTTVWMLCNGPGFQSPSFDSAIAQRGANTENSFSKDWNETGDMFTFEPERWLRKKENPSGEGDEFEHNGNAAPNFAFGQGFRGCWGRRLAYVELRVVVTLLIWHFDLLPVKPALNYTPATLSVISRSDACYVRLRRRNDTR